MGTLTALLVPVRSAFGPLNIGLLYLLLVVALAARWGWAVGLFTSVAANLAFNFFFVPPRYHFTVAGPANVLELAVFLGVAAVTSALLGRARAGEAAARRRAQETAILYELSRLIITAPCATAILGTICERVHETFAPDACAVLLPRDGQLALVAARGEAASRTRTAYERRAADEAMATGTSVILGALGRRRPRVVGLRDRNAPVIYIPLRVGEHTVGILEVVGALRTRVVTEDELRLLGAFADIAALATDRERLLHQAADAAALKDADGLKSALLAAVSHDLRTPLASIKSSVSGLLDPGVVWDAVTRRELLSAVDEETDRLSRVVTDLLDLSRIEGGALRPRTDWYDVQELLETTIAGLTRTTTRHHLVLDVAEGTGAAPFDYVLVGQVVTNLVENAAKFAPVGTEIRVTAHRLPTFLELSVRDHGPGVPAEEREHIFEKFYRVHRTEHRTTGTGLGLAISKGVVEAHGGNIRVEDASDGGARFVVTLPVVEAAAAERPYGGRQDHPVQGEVPVR